MPTIHPKLEAQLAGLDPALRAKLDRAGFDARRFLELAATLTEGDPKTRRVARNSVKGEVSAPRPGEISPLPAPGTPEHERLRKIGADAIARGELAFCTMAGGMATRMGGVVKGLVEVLPGQTFLALRLQENAHASARAGRAIPLWLMTSDATHDALVTALRDAKAPDHVVCFQQELSLRLTPDGQLFEEDGQPSTYATGHGDLVDALRRATSAGEKILDGFLARGGKYVWITNLDNLGASIDEAVLGHFVDSGKDAQCEVVAKAGDKGGIPVHAEGKLQVLEEFRFPPSFDPATVPVFNTNTFLVSAAQLARAPLGWTWFEVEKKVEGAPAVQFERLVQELTAYLPTTFLEVPRSGKESRFLPVKDFDELARRKDEIAVVAKARGML